MNILTIIVLLIILFFVFNGYRRGFIKTFVSMVSIIVAILLVSVVTPYVAQFLKNQTPLYSVIEKKCEDTFVSQLTGSEDEGATQTDSVKSDSTLSKLEQIKAIENLKVPKVIQQMLKNDNNKSSYEALAAQSFSQYVCGYLAILILNIISFVVTFLLVICVLRLTVMTLDVITSLPILHGINQLLGLGLGLLQGVVFVWIVFLIITVFSSTEMGRHLMQMIYESPILSYIYDNNLLLRLLMNVLSFWV